MRHVVSAVAAALAMTPAYAYAQAEDTKALAEQLFKQGRELAKKDRWEEACPKFEASLRYDPALGTKLNLASCYEHVGKLASAWGIYRDLLELATKAGDAKRADYAKQQIAALEPRLPTLLISVPPDVPPGFVVERNGTPVAAGAFGSALYVDPGTHKVVASAPGFEPLTQSITLGERKAETLAIPPLVAKPASPVPALTPPTATSFTASDVRTEDGRSPKRSRTRKYVGIGVGAAGVTALGVGLAFGLKARSTYKDLESRCPGLVCDMADEEEGRALYDDATSAATTSTVLVISGAAAVVGGLVLVLTAPKAAERANARIVPTIQDRGAGLALTGGF